MPFVDADKVKLFAVVEVPKRPELAHLGGPKSKNIKTLPFVDMSLTEMKCLQDIQQSGMLEIMPGVYMGAHVENGAIYRDAEIVTGEEKDKQITRAAWVITLASLVMFAGGFTVGVLA